MSAALDSDYRTLAVEPLTPQIGAELTGFKMSGALPQEQIDEIRRALLEWKVIFFRDQDVAVEDHVAFGRRFGELEVHPFTPNREDHPEVVVLHNDEQSKFGVNFWHSDVTWRQEPSLGSILRARIVPAVGGDTPFADRHAAYEVLDDATREVLPASHGGLLMGALDEALDKEIFQFHADLAHQFVLPQVDQASCPGLLVADLAVRFQNNPVADIGFRFQLFEH